MPSYATVTLEQPADHVALVTMTPGEKIICLSEGLLRDLRDVLHRLAEDDRIRVLIITGTGKVFCAGADLKLLQRASPEEARKYLDNVITLFSYLDSFPKPTIAAINGFALGGGMEMTLAMDFRLISETAAIG